MADIKHHKVLTTPPVNITDSDDLFVVKSASSSVGNRAVLYIMDSSGNPHAIWPGDQKMLPEEVKGRSLGYGGEIGGGTGTLDDNLASLQRDKIGYFQGLGALPSATTVDVRYRTAEHANASGTDHTSEITQATTTLAGVMSAADKVKLDSIVVNYKGVYQNVAALNTAHATGVDGEWAIVLNAAGPAQHHSWDANSSTWEAVDFASITGTTNLGYTASPTDGTITSDTGADATIPLVDVTNAGLMSPASLAAIATNTSDITTNAAAIATNAAAIVAISDTDDQTAAEVTFTPAGNLAATNTQDALEELDNEKTSLLYVHSRGEGIITNYSGLLQDNTNFSQFIYDGAVSPNLPASFRHEGYYGNKQSNEFIPVDPNKAYRTEIMVRQEGLPGDYSAYTFEERHSQYCSIRQFDVDGLPVDSYNHMYHYRTGTPSYTVLTQTLTPGDTVVHVADSSGWNNSGNNTLPWYRRSAIIFGYKNSLGFQYDYYSRLYAVGWTFTPNTGVNDTLNTITFDSGMPVTLGNPDDVNGTWPVGTKIANSSAGGTYKYAILNSHKVPETDKWYKFTNFIGGIDRSGLNYPTNFSPGCSQIKVGWLANYSNRAGGLSIFPDTGPTHAVWFAGLSLMEERSAKVAENPDKSNAIHVLKTTIGGGFDFSENTTTTVEEIPS